MTQVFDISGFENICKYIEASKKSKFTVYRYGQSGYNLPVFESTQHDTWGNALADFKNFAGILNKQSIYKMILFDEMEEVGIMGEGAGKKSKKKTGKFEILFCIEPSQYQAPGYEHKSAAPQMAFNPDQLKESIISEITRKNEESAVLKALQGMEDRLKAIEISQIEDDDDDEDEDELSGDNMGNLIQGVTMLANMLKGGQAPPPVINGDESEATTQAEIDPKIERVNKINAAIKTLYKHDKGLHDTLTKLAEIAENKPDTFKFLLSNLGNL